MSLAVLPELTLMALAPTALVVLLARNVVLGAAVGFVSINVATMVAGQAWPQIFLCLLLSFVVTATYLGSSWRQTLTAIRERRWLTLFSFE